MMMAAADAGRQAMLAIGAAILRDMPPRFKHIFGGRCLRAMRNIDDWGCSY